MIQLGSQLDIFVSEEDAEGTDTVTDWVKGTVAEIKGNMLKVEFADLPAHYDKWINKLSDEVAPPGSKTTQDIEWRQSILQSEANTVIDAYKDKDDKWVEATILETKTE